MPPATPTETLRPADQQYDYKAREYHAAGQTGLYYLRARYGACPERSRRDPTLGRFLTPDPLRGSPTDPQSLNRYAYAGNNPVNRTDPTGLLTESSASDDLIDLLLVWERSNSCAGALAKMSIGLTLVRYGLINSAAGPTGTLFGQVLIVYGFSLIAVGQMDYQDNCTPLVTGDG